MCGIGGWSWKKNNLPSKATRKALVVSLGILNDSRGGKGYGVFDADNRTVHKGVDTFGLFFGRKGAEFALSRMGFLHTRFPSKGSVCKSNSHPFTFGHVTGAHNGTLINHEELNKKYDRKFEVDSMHIFAHLNEGKSLEDIEAYGAIEWYDSRDQQIRIVYFNNGDLEGVRTPYGCVWSSSKFHLGMALDAADLDTKKEDVVLVANQIYNVTKGDFILEDKLVIGKYTSKRTWQNWASDGEYVIGCGAGRTYSSDTRNSVSIAIADKPLENRTPTGTLIGLTPLHETTNSGTLIKRTEIAPNTYTYNRVEPTTEYLGNCGQVDDEFAKVAPEADSGFFDHQENSIIWSELQYHNTVWDKDGVMYDGQALGDQWENDYGDYFDNLESEKLEEQEAKALQEQKDLDNKDPDLLTEVEWRARHESKYRYFADEDTPLEDTAIHVESTRDDEDEEFMLLEKVDKQIEEIQKYHKNKKAQLLATN